MTKRKLTKTQRAILNAAGKKHAVIWPHAYCKAVVIHSQGRDGRVHYTAPLEDAFAIHGAGLIDRHGVITPAGRAMLSTLSVGEGK